MPKGTSASEDQKINNHKLGTAIKSEDVKPGT